MWVLDDENEPTIERKFVVLNACYNQTNFDNLEFIGTVQLDDGNYIVHVFEYIDK